MKIAHLIILNKNCSTTVAQWLAGMRSGNAPAAPRVAELSMRGFSLHPHPNNKS